MKLTKSVNRRVGNKEYVKYIITIPQKFTKELGWDENTELNMKLDPKSGKPKKIVIEKEKT